jgi:plasmid stabilization system protein ParE
LDRIWNWLAIEQKVPESADRVCDAIEGTFYLLARNPGIGIVRWPSHPALADIRMLVVPRYHNYLVFYRDTPDAVQIVAVIHGKRDLPRRLLESRRFE